MKGPGANLREAGQKMAAGDYGGAAQAGLAEGAKRGTQAALAATGVGAAAAGIGGKAAEVVVKSKVGKWILITLVAAVLLQVFFVISMIIIAGGGMIGAISFV